MNDSEKTIDPATAQQIAQEVVVEKKQEQKGKITSLLFSLIVTVFLAWQCLSYERRNEPVPVVVWFPSLMFIAGGLGVVIDAKSIGKLIGN